jgi:hypothetical protein
VPTSEEVLAPPARPDRPVLRAVVTLVVVGLVAWAVVAKASGEGPGAPTAAPPQSSPSSTPTPAGRPPLIAPPPWVRYPTPLEGRWRGAGPVGRLTLDIADARLSLIAAEGDRSVRYIRVEGHRVYVRPVGDDAELATYRWQIDGDRLRFRLLERTAKAALGLEALTFRRRA